MRRRGVPARPVWGIPACMPVCDEWIRAAGIAACVTGSLHLLHLATMCLGGGAWQDHDKACDCLTGCGMK